MKIQSQLKDQYLHIMRKSGILRKIIKWILIFLCVIAFLSSLAYFITIPRYPITIQNREYTVYEGVGSIQETGIDLKTGTISIKTKGGATWLSNLDLDTSKKDELAKGINRITMLSQMVITYVDKDNRTYIATSYANALSNGEKSLDAKQTGKTVVAEYDFLTGKATDKLYIKIPVEFTFGEGSLRVKVLTDKIVENIEFKLLDISLLPYLGAAANDEEGYIFVPDGSGALIPFNETVSGAKEWNQMIYGRDPSLKTKIKTEVTEAIRLPVFGIKHKNSAMLAIVDQGDALCSITAQIKGMNSSWNTAFFTYRYREYDTITLNEMGWNERNIPYVSKKPNSAIPFTVQYYFLDNENADYVGMAKIHREYLIQKENLKKIEKTETVPFYMDVNMSVRRIKSILGLPTGVVEPLTTFDELSTMIQSFKTEGADSVVVKMNGWLSGGPFNEVSNKTSFEQTIGGKNGFKDLTKLIKSDPTIKLFPSSEFINGYVNGNGFVSVLQGNRDITGALSLQYQFLRSTGTKNLRRAGWSLITPSYSLGLLDNFLGTYHVVTDLGVKAIALDGYGETLYADRYESVLNKIVSRTPVDRQSALDLWQQALKLAKENTGELMITGGNAYAIPYADYIMGIPMSSSSFKITSTAVPYYQILTSGLVKTTSTPINFSENLDVFYLNCLETGTYPLYSFFAKEASLVKNTDLNTLYNGQYTGWIDTAMKKYKEFHAAYKAINGASITDYEKSDNNQTVTKFDNGVKIIVDYNKNTFQMTGGEN